MDVRSFQNHVVLEASENKGLEEEVKLLRDLVPKPLDTSELRVLRKADDGSCRLGCRRTFGTSYAAHQKRLCHELECHFKTERCIDGV